MEQNTNADKRKPAHEVDALRSKKARPKDEAREGENEKRKAPGNGILPTQAVDENLHRKQSENDPSVEISKGKAEHEEHETKRERSLCRNPQGKAEHEEQEAKRERSLCRNLQGKAEHDEQEQANTVDHHIEPDFKAGEEEIDSGVVTTPSGPTTCASPKYPIVGTGSDLNLVEPLKELRGDDEAEGKAEQETYGGRVAYGSRAQDPQMGRRVANDSTRNFDTPHQCAISNSLLHLSSGGQPLSHGHPQGPFLTQGATISSTIQVLRHPPW